MKKFVIKGEVPCIVYTVLSENDTEVLLKGYTHRIIKRVNKSLLEEATTQNIKKEEDGDIVIETIIFDENETRTVSSYPVKFVADSQALGSAITYARRYSLYSALGIYPDKVDDGAAMREYAQQHANSTQQTNQLRNLIDHYRAAGVSLQATASALIGHKIEKPADIPVTLYKQLFNMI